MPTALTRIHRFFHFCKFVTEKPAWYDICDSAVQYDGHPVKAEEWEQKLAVEKQMISYIGSLAFYAVCEPVIFDAINPFGMLHDRLIPGIRSLGNRKLFIIEPGPAYEPVDVLIAGGVTQVKRLDQALRKMGSIDRSIFIGAGSSTQN